MADLVPERPRPRALLAVESAVLRVGLAPLGRLGRAMAAADLLRPGARAEVAGPVETAALITTYNTMPDREMRTKSPGAVRSCAPRP